MRKIAKVKSDPTISLVLNAEGSTVLEWYGPEFVAVVEVIAHVFTESRKILDDRGFHSIDEAYRYCESVHGVTALEWEDVPKHRATLDVEYELTHHGVPQPILLNLQKSADLEISVTDPAQGEQQVLILGSPEGLRKLAAILLVTAESRSFDPSYHAHVDADREHSGNIDAYIALRPGTCTSRLKSRG